MLKTVIFYVAIITSSSVTISLQSCNNNTAVPFPVNYKSYAAPITKPLKFNTVKKLNWVTLKSIYKKPVVKKLDVDALSTAPYDTADFRPIRPSGKVSFNWDSLPNKPFSLDNLPSQPLKFKTTVLYPATSIKSLAPSATNTQIFVVGQPQGIPGKYTTCLFKDTKGFIWIATEKGLFCYDGVNSRQYTILSSPQSISGLAEDDFGRMWFTYQGGIGIIDRHSGIVRLSIQIKAYGERSKMLKDHNGSIWVCNSLPLGVIIIDPTTQTFKHFDTKTGLSGNYDWDADGLVEDRHKNIWISHSQGGADIINLERGRIRYLTKANGLCCNSISAAIIDSSGLIWFIVDKHGIEAVDMERGTITDYSKLEGIKWSRYSDLLRDSKNRIWINTEDGIVVLDPGKALVKHIKLNNFFGSFLLLDDKKRVWAATRESIIIIEKNRTIIYPGGGENPSAMVEDSAGRIWSGTIGFGIEILDSKNHTKVCLRKENGLSSNIIYGLSEVNKEIWVISNRGLDVIDLRHKIILQGVIKNDITAIMKDDRGNVWFTRVQEGLGFFDSASKTIKHTDMAGGLSGNFIVDIKQDKHGMIWVATEHNGVDIINPETGTVSSLTSNPGIQDTCEKILKADELGRMWVGTDNGLYVADTKKETITVFGTREGLPDNEIRSLISYHGRFVVGTGSKVSIIKAPEFVDSSYDLKNPPNEWKISPIASAADLINQYGSFKSDIITKNGEYQSRGNGITVIENIEEEHDSSITYITGIDIMSRPQYFVNQLHFNEFDTLWSNDSFYVNGNVPINASFLQKRDMYWDSVSGPYNLPVNLQIPYNKNYLQFQFAQAHLGRQDTVLYSYILEGIDKKWSDFTYKTSTENYLNLLPGNYAFKVCSKQPNGLWSEPSTFSFTIIPPWWQTLWAYITYTFLLIAIIRSLIHYHSQKLRKEKRILEENVIQRTHQLKVEKEKVESTLAELKSTQAQLIQSEKMASLGELTAGIAHEIQNPLNFVNNFSEVNKELLSELDKEIEKGNYDDVKAIAKDITDNEQKINHHGKRADAIVKGMLQHSRHSKGVIEATDINKLADEYLRLSYHGLRAKNTSFKAILETDYDKALEKLNVIPQDIGIVLLNLYNNAFYSVSKKKKQGSENYEPTVKVITKGVKNKILIIVQDNGNGISQKVIGKIFQPFFTTKPPGEGTGLGLSLSYDIIKAHGGEIKVETIDQESANFIIELPSK